MTCEELNGLLDRLMDGELSAEQRREMEAHSAACPECAAAIRSTEQLKALFDEMEPEADVPLEAQARWRGAVREASKGRGRKRLYRWIGSVAAAVVVLVGVGLALNLKPAPKQMNAALTVADQAPEAPEAEAAEVAYKADRAALVRSNDEDVALEAEEFAAAGSAVVETDGAMADYAEEEAEEFCDSEAASIPAAMAQRAPAWELTLRVEDVDTACARIRDLVEEYEGSADVQPMAEDGANVYVEINAENAGDFINAVAPLDASGQRHDSPEFTEGDRVLLLLALRS